MKERELLMIKVKLDDSHVIINDNSKSKKIILEKASEIFYQSSGISKDVIFNKLYEREKLGSTSVGKGVAIPHARIENIDYPYLSIILLNDAVEFDNIDDLNVDIIISIIVPNKDFEEHLKLLSCISEKLDNQETRKDLRHARNSRDILTILESNNLEFI
tara:strand:+ start:1546 stop:2025 length:480 start_codon:yes stop_codon:yes gene_type:complete